MNFIKNIQNNENIKFLFWLFDWLSDLFLFLFLFCLFVTFLFLEGLHVCVWLCVEKKELWVSQVCHNNRRKHLSVNRRKLNLLQLALQQQPCFLVPVRPHSNVSMFHVLLHQILLVLHQDLFFRMTNSIVSGLKMVNFVCPSVSASFLTSFFCIFTLFLLFFVYRSCRYTIIKTNSFWWWSWMVHPLVGMFVFSSLFLPAFILLLTPLFCVCE